MAKRVTLIPQHGGYRRLKSFRVAQLVYDATVCFCDRFIDKRSRTHDQMVQAARSGVQNIAEGSKASGTSKKMELKLTNVARASLEELRLDYEDYLRQRELQLWPPGHPALMRFKAKRCATLEEFKGWVQEEIGVHTDEHGLSRTDTDKERNLLIRSVPVRESPCLSVQNREPSPVAELAANAALSLLNLACYLLDRQIAAQADAFEREGGFTERLYRIRQARRKGV
jgi:four helix bundle suffix protein